jgi:hypothetical protein
MPSNPVLPPLLSLPRVNMPSLSYTRAPTTETTCPNANAVFTSAGHGSYLQVALKLAVPSPTTVRSRFLLPKSGCLRCLASDHLVKECRDPLRCHRCGASGHMERRCSQWPPRKETPWPPRYPTIPIMTGRLPVHPVPLSIRDTSIRACLMV